MYQRVLQVEIEVILAYHTPSKHKQSSTLVS